MTGRSLLPVLRDAGVKVRDELHGHINNQHMLHDGRYKYLYFADDGRELLFDKQNDPLDEQDLSQRRELIEPLRQRLIQHLAAENHEHVREGRLANFGKQVSKKDLSNVLGWMGLAGSA